MLLAWENEAFLAVKELGPDKFEIVVPSLQHPGRAAGRGRGQGGRQEGHARGGPGLPRVPLLARGAGDRGQALLPAAATRPRWPRHAGHVPEGEARSRSTRCSAAGRRRRRPTSPTAASSTRSTASSGRSLSRLTRHARCDLTARPDATMRFERRHSVLPGFGLTLGFTLFYLSLDRADPARRRSSSRRRPSGGTRSGHATTAPRVLASYRLTFGASLAAALVNAVFGLVVAWVLVRYRFPGRRVVDALVDLPFALPTAVAGIALTDALRARTAGSAGRSSRWASRSAFTPLGVVVALTFIGLPFVVRTLQPVLEDLDPEVEEAAASLGASRLADRSRASSCPRSLPGAAHRLRAGLRPGARRVRLGRLHLRQHADEDRDRAAADRDQARAVRLRRGDGHRRGHAGGVVRCCSARSTCCRRWSARRRRRWRVTHAVGAGAATDASRRRRPPSLPDRAWRSRSSACSWCCRWPPSSPQAFEKGLGGLPGRDPRARRARGASA